MTRFSKPYAEPISNEQEEENYYARGDEKQDFDDSIIMRDRSPTSRAEDDGLATGVNL